MFNERRDVNNLMTEKVDKKKIVKESSSVTSQA